MTHSYSAGRYLTESGFSLLINSPGWNSRGYPPPSHGVTCTGTLTGAYVSVDTFNALASQRNGYGGMHDHVYCDMHNLFNLNTFTLLDE